MRNLCVICVVGFLGSCFSQTDIRKPPAIVRNPRASVTFRSEDSVTLECKAEGIPAVSYEWTKNGFELNQNLPNIHKGADGTITIQPATSMDEGFYQCFARNQYGTALSITSHIQITIFDSTGIPTVLQKTVQEGMPFHIQADPRKSFPKPAYGWEIAADSIDTNPIALRASKRIQIAQNGDLHFAYANLDDALGGKVYKFTTYNPNQDVKAGGSYTKVTVTPRNVTQFAPTLQFASEVQIVAVIGGSVTLRCFFSGNPEPSISWSGPSNTRPVGRYVQNRFDTEFTIFNITASDEGDYVCSASNTKGQNKHTLQIRVEASPRFSSVKNGPYDVNVTEGESFTFNCNANAKPEARIVWLQDGKELDPNNPPKRFVFSNDKKSLTIKDVCKNCNDRQSQTDLSVIQCNASNVHGYAFGSGYLNVLSKTEVTIHNETEMAVNINKEGEVRFQCSATSDPSTPPTFQWLKVETEGNEQLHNDSPFVTVEDGLLTIHVPANATEIWPKYLRQYICVVNNGHSTVNQTTSITAAVIALPVVTASLCGQLFGLEVCWIWVSIGAAVFGLFVILVIVCFAVCKHNNGDKYDIDGKERWTGRDPGKELLDDGFQEYQRQECLNSTLLGSRPSFSSTTLLRITEEETFNDYAEDEGKFSEDGSFVGGTYRSRDRFE